MRPSLKFLSPRDLTVLLLALALGAGPLTERSYAQCGDRIQTELQRTDELLQRAREKLRESIDQLNSANAERAKSLLTIAFKMQEEAKKSCLNGDGRTAAQLTMEARDKARGALGAINLTDESEPALERQLRRTDEMLERVGERLPPDAPRPARAQFERALEAQRRAWEMFRQGHPRVALKLTREAARMVEGLVREFRDHRRSEETVRQRIEALTQALEEATQRIADCENTDARGLLEKAESALAGAQELLRDGHREQAETSLKLALELAREAQLMCEEGGRLERHLEYLKQKVETLRAEATGNSEALKLIDAAAQNLVEAEKLLDAGLPRAAAGQLKAAELLLGQAQRMIEG